MTAGDSRVEHDPSAHDVAGTTRLLGWRARRYPFTLATCGLIVFAGFLSSTAAGQSISGRALHQFGSSQRDLIALDLGRVITSAFVTDGGTVFWVALAFTALFVGAAEHFTDTWTAAITFWTAHFATFAASLLVTAWLGMAGSRLANLLFATRDVGPSAGYVGCLGLALVCSGWRWRWLAIGAIAIGLCVTLARSVPGLHAAPRVFSADFAHAIALVVGVAAGLIVESRKGRT
jgi:hypothetical protein